MFRARRLGTLALTLLLVAPLAAQPPQVHQVGDHWSAWQPPMLEESEGEVYIIQPGDTLWALAQQFLGDPYLWPQLWEQNQYILDAHWIYPGDPLLLSAEVLPQEAMEDSGYGEAGSADADREGMAEMAEPELTGFVPAERALTPPKPLGSEADIYCSGFIAGRDLEYSYRISGSESQVLGLPDSTVLTTQYDSFSEDLTRVVLSTGDIIYLDGGRDTGLTAGLLYTVVAPTVDVYHPDSNEYVGTHYAYFGRVRVLSVQETTAIAEIVHACRAIGVGQELLPFEPEPVPLGRLGMEQPTNDPVDVSELDGAPTIVFAGDKILTLGEGNLVYIDRGEVDDITPGDLFTIYRRNKSGFPPVVIGELAILSVRQQTALGRIMRSRYTVFIGDQLSAR